MKRGSMFFALVLLGFPPFHLAEAKEGHSDRVSIGVRPSS
jgi:hypothetical protein